MISFILFSFLKFAFDAVSKIKSCIAFAFFSKLLLEIFKPILFESLLLFGSKINEALIPPVIDACCLCISSNDLLLRPISVRRSPYILDAPNSSRVKFSQG